MAPEPTPSTTLDPATAGGPPDGRQDAPVGGPAPVVAVGTAVEDWTGDARFHEYTEAVDPIRTGHTPPVPIHRFPASVHAGAGTRAVALDLADALGTPGPATSPGMLAEFVVVEAGDELTLPADWASELTYCLRGRGSTTLSPGPGPGPGPVVVHWAAGDVVTLPGGGPATYRATEDALLYRVTDAPLLRWLGATPADRRFAPTRYDGVEADRRLRAVAAHPDAGLRNRVSILLGNATMTQTLTATPTLWAMLGILPVDAVQRPHRHQSAALDLIVACEPGCYTLVGRALGDDGSILDPVRVDWESAGAFVTPPGAWHSHHNESGAPARLFPVQDAGLHTYLRSLDIRFS